MQAKKTHSSKTSKAKQGKVAAEKVAKPSNKSIKADDSKGQAKASPRKATAPEKTTQLGAKPVQKVAEQPVRVTSAVATRNKNILYASLTANAVFIAMLIAFSILTHTRSFWFATKVHDVYQRTCPTKVADKADVKKTSSDVTTTTYYLGSPALQSGCAEPIMHAAQLDNYRAHPDQAQSDAEVFRKISPDHTLNVTVIKSSENGTQLVPMQIKQ